MLIRVFFVENFAVPVIFRKMFTDEVQNLVSKHFESKNPRDNQDTLHGKQM